MANAAAAGSFFTNAFTAFQEPKIVVETQQPEVFMPEEIFTAPAAQDEVIFHPVAQPEPDMAQPPAPPSAPAALADEEDDYDTPSYIKRERRLFQ